MKRFTMKRFDQQYYLDLCQRLSEQQYDSIDDSNDYDDIAWTPSEPEAKKKITQPNAAISDVTDMPSSDIKKQIFLYNNLKVGKFKIKINRYCAKPSQEGAQININLAVWEEKNKTPNGMPCRMDCAVNFIKDTRFIGCSWLKYFGNSGNNNSANNVPIDVAYDIVRWLQALRRLSAFI